MATEDQQFESYMQANFGPLLRGQPTAPLGIAIAIEPEAESTSDEELEALLASKSDEELRAHFRAQHVGPDPDMHGGARPGPTAPSDDELVDAYLRRAGMISS